VESAGKSLPEKARTACQLGLAETALELLTRADIKDLRDERNTREVPGATLAIDLLLGLGRIDDVRAALTPDPNSNQPYDKRSFGTYSFGPNFPGLPGYEWFQVLLGAATGDYESADRNLAECIERRQKCQEYSSALVELDLAPMTFLEKESDKLELVGSMVGHVLLREAQLAGGMPWQVVRIIPYWLHLPHVRMGLDGKPRGTNPRPGATTVRGAEMLFMLLQQEADLWTLRGWLALEAGQLDRAREYIGKAFQLAEVGGGEKGVHYSLFYRSRPLGGLVREMLRGKK
jgi:hypothetical protein